MTVGRRDALSLGAFGIGSVALGGCESTLPDRSTTGAGIPMALPKEDVDRLFTDHDRVMANLRGVDPEQAWTAHEREAGDATCSRILEAVCLMGTYRDVPHSAWREPPFKERAAETFPRIHMTLAAAHRHLAGISDAHGSRIDEKLRHEPDLPMRVLESIDEQAKRIHVPREQRLHLRLAVTQLSSRLRYEGAKEVTSGLAAKYDRALTSRASVLAKSDPSPDPAPASPSTVQASPPPGGGGPAGGPVPSAAETPPPRSPPVATPIFERPLGSVGESCRSNDDCDGALLCSSNACKLGEQPTSEQHRLLATTKKVAKVGLYLLIPPLCAIGVLVLITCLFMLIVASTLPAKGG
jgi:hypothetical protein